MNIDIVAEFDRATAHELMQIVREGSPLYQRLRANCSPESSLWPSELDMHAAAVARVVTAARTQRPPHTFAGSATASDKNGA